MEKETGRKEGSKRTKQEKVGSQWEQFVTEIANRKLNAN